MDEKTLVRCTRAVLMQCIGNEGTVSKVAASLHEQSFISSAQNKIILSNVKNGFSEEAAGSLAELAFQTDPKNWTENLETALSILPEEDALLLLLKALFSCTSLSPDMVFLFEVCDKLTNQCHEVNQLEKKRSLTSESIPTSKKAWLAGLLLKCLLEDGESQVKQFVSDVKQLFYEKASTGDPKLSGSVYGIQSMSVPVSDQQHKELTMDHYEGGMREYQASNSSRDIELRIVLAEGVAGTCDRLRVHFNRHGDWSMIPMNMLPCGDIYHCFIPVLRSVSRIEYKYGLMTESGMRWEEYPSVGQINSNRILICEELKGSAIVQDVASFPSMAVQARPWILSCQECMAYHLIAAQYSLMQLTDKRKFCSDLFAWLRQVKMGWKLTNAYPGHIVLPLKEMQDYLLVWLSKMVHKVHRQFGQAQVIVTSLTVIVGLFASKTVVVHQEFLGELFQFLAIHELSGERRTSLRNEIFQKCNVWIGGSIEIIRDAIHALYKQLRYHPIPDFLVSLPLYWLIVGRDTAMTEYTDSQAAGDILLEKSGLPRSLKLEEIRRAFQNSASQRGLLALAQTVGEISKICPMIVGSYQFLLEDRKLVELIRNESGTNMKQAFPLDSVLYQLLNACRRGDLKIADVMKMYEYFEERFKLETENAEKNAKHYDKAVVLKKIEVSENIISWVSSLLTDVTSKSATQEALQNVNQCVAWCLNIARLATGLALASTRNDLELEITKLREGVVAMSSSVSCWIHKCKIDRVQISFLNSVVAVHWPDEKLRVKWKEIMKTEIKDKISKTWYQKKDEDFLDFYATTLETIYLEDAVESCLSEKAFQCTGNILSKYSFDQNTRKDHSSKSYASAVYKNIMSWIKKPRFISIFDRLFQKEYQKALTFHPNDPAMQALTVLFSWSFALKFYELFYQQPAMDKFSEKTQEHIDLVADVFREIVQSLKSGEIVIMQLQQIIKHRVTFIDLCKHIESLQWTVDFSEHHLPQLIDKRQEQLLAFETATEHVRGFLQTCSKLDEGGECIVKTTELKDKLRDSTNVTDKMLTDISGGDEDTPTFLNLSPGVLKKFEAISSIKDGKVFQEIFHQNALAEKAESAGYECDLGDSGLWHVSWRDVVGSIWKGTQDDIANLVQEIDEGALSLSTAKEWFQRCSGDPDEIKREVKMLYDHYNRMAGMSNHAEPPKAEVKKDSSEDSDWGSYNSDDDSVPSEQDLDSEYDDDEVQSYETVTNMSLRSEQLASFFLLDKAEETIKIMLEIRDVLSLTGNFSSVERLQAKAYSGGTLNDLPSDVNVPVVCRISEYQIHCLKCFIKERELISWLKEEMNDIGEVQVMCDLAMISAGETPYEVDIVSCLLGAVMGFSPLIFDLDSEADLDELLTKCNTVWKNVETDKKLLEKWNDAGNQLTWFKGIGNARGSVEKQSLSLARDINRRGVYIIERKKVGGAVSYKDCVRATLVNEDGLQENYNLDQLFDLQCKLMLIAGEAETGWNDVSCFVRILESVQIIAETFVKLFHAGCMLFKRWSALITCNNATMDTQDALMLEIKFGEDCLPLLGCASVGDLVKLSGILNESLCRWKEYVDEMRIKYYFLNSYNMLQIIYLCHELATHGERIPDQVSTLLSFVGGANPDMNVHELLNEVMKIREENPVGQDIPEQGGKAAGDKIALVRQLMDEESVGEKVAKAAVQAEFNEDEPEYVTWILLNQFEEEEVERLCLEFNKESETLHQQLKERNIVSILYDRSTSTLDEVIGRLQKKKSSSSVMDSVDAICRGYHDETTTITLDDSLSIQHLGRFLDFFHQRYPSSNVNRNLIEPFTKGQPNLLICSEQEILTSVLYLYMMDETQPLPTAFEVLLCSETTSVDEVERFMRRAMCKKESDNKLLFTLAFADKLDFNVSSATEKIFHLLTTVAKNPDYQLVVLLSKPQHYLATCFDKFVVEGKWMTSGPDVPSYLSRNLKRSSEHIKLSAVQDDKVQSTVKVVGSMHSGVGKSLYVQRTHEEICKKSKIPKTTIRLLERSIDVDYVVERLLRPFGGGPVNQKPLLVHLDLTPAVHKGIASFSFNLFILGSIQNSQGYVWKRNPNHLYMIEVTLGDHLQKVRFLPHHILMLLPSVMCSPPRKVLENLQSDEDEEFVGMDEKEFSSETYQRPFQYLHLHDNKKENPSVLDVYRYKKPGGTPKQCLEVLLKHCCMHNPSWAQLRHFSSFLNIQLRNCENSVFCDPSITGLELRGLRAFAIEFMIRMSQDFATPSLVISDESSPRQEEEDLTVYQFRRKWEESSHPYLFFNEDRATMTFINVNISDQGDLLDKNGEVVEEGIISAQLVQGLKRQGVSLDLNFDTFTREKKLIILCQVMGIERVFDPDPTYKLTTDNVLKILAVYMRFRCQIPVIIMGETGCGKTRMIEFISRLKAGQRQDGIRSMVTLKIHGGITVNDIYRSVQNACDISSRKSSSNDFGTILFYDEANTTEAIYALKEVMCDVTVDGKSFKSSDLKLVAACNPYKQLSPEAIKKLEDSGLGYRIKTCDTTHLFGNVPIRTLVYRVVALPPSMQPFVWDFGQLSAAAERMYIHEMTKKLGEKLGLDRDSMAIINAVLYEAQNYMRSRPDECRYVSLRDVERCVIVYEWFHQRRETLYPEIEKEIRRRYARMQQASPEISDELRTLLQTIGICYHSSLEDRRGFREEISYTFGLEGFHLPPVQIHEEILAAQSVFLQNMKMEDNIALNEALSENAFMMTVCADMRIPLFLIGKPGTSKSLAKTIVGDNMRGTLSHSSLCKQLKQVHIISYQCSALTDAAGIETVFKQCTQLQAKQDSNSYSAVVVLDEIGLAEDSPNMPLKVLHPLLEGSGTGGDSLLKQEPSERVGFIGISNWALDPAKMNRGIFVTRSKPSKDDLKKTAKGIFRNQKSKINENLELLEKLTESYMKIYEDQEVEYFGLRDYYSLIKMLHYKCVTAESSLTVDDVTTAIHRNFSGGKTSLFEIFRQNIQHLYKERLSATVPLQKVIHDNLNEKESRYLLLLTNQFSAASLLQLCIKNSKNQVQTIFGSSFPGDHQYSDICRNINKIKAYMETGKSVVLLNMTEIHESLYDALNQHYVTFGGQRYVDLGLGGHRVKCRIAPEFRLIVVEQKEIVYKQYPIPLINRLEKHHLDSRSLLSDDQRATAKSLEHWVEKFINVGSWDFKGKDAFMGYHSDTVCSVVLLCSTHDEETLQKVLLESASMDSIFRLGYSQIGGQCEHVQTLYLQQQTHDDLVTLLRESAQSTVKYLLEVVSYSNVLTENDRLEIGRQFGEGSFVMLLCLEQFETEREYNNKLKEFFDLVKSNEGGAKVLLIQCSQAQSRGQLVECAKFSLKNMWKEYSGRSDLNNMIVAIILSAEREGDSSMTLSSLSLQHSSNNRIVYIDELRTSESPIRPASVFYKKTIVEIFQSCATQLDEKTSGTLVDIKALLRDCICDTVTRVRSKTHDSGRYLQRIKILSDLFMDKLPVSEQFQKFLLAKVIQLYAEKEEQGMFMVNQWTVSEACSRDSLQEGGTFRKTLWLSLKNRLSRLIAFIVAMADKQNNLDLLLQQIPWKVEMWMSVYKNLALSWNAIGQAQEFFIASPPHHKVTVPCRVPFSYQIHQYLMDQWNTLNEENSPNIDKLFFSLYRKSKFCDIIRKATASSGIAKFVEMYAADLVQYLYVAKSEQEIEITLVSDIINQLSMQRFLVLRNEKSFSEGDECPIVFMCYQEMSENLLILSDIFRLFPDLLANRNWMEQVNQRSIHSIAFQELMKSLEKVAEKFREPVMCLKWKSQALMAKNLFKRLINRVSNPAEKALISRKWIPIELVHLFLDHMIPNDAETEVFQRYLSVISSKVLFLWRFVTRTSVATFEVLKITLKVLRDIHDEIRMKLLIHWQDSTCSICQRVLTAPTMLPCGHFYCNDCVHRLIMSLDGGMRKCPSCTQMIPPNTNLVEAQLDGHQQSELDQLRSNCTSFFMEYLDHFCFGLEEKPSSEKMHKIIEILISQIVLENDFKKEDKVDTTAIDLNINFKTCVVRILLDTYPDVTLTMLEEKFLSIDRYKMENIVCIVMKCFEDQVFLNVSKNTTGRVEILEYWDSLLKSSFQKLQPNNEYDGLKMEILRNVAEVRCCLMEAGSCIDDIFKKKVLEDDVNAKTDIFLSDVIGLCASEEVVVSTFQEFLVKSSFHIYGSDWFYQVKSNQNMEDLIPTSLSKADENEKTDRWVLLGESYLSEITKLYKTPANGRDAMFAEIFQGGIEGYLKILACLTVIYEEEDLKKQEISKMIAENVTSDHTFLKFIANIFSDFLPLLKNVEDLTTTQVHAIFQLTTLIVYAAANGSHMMACFRLLITNATSAEHLYLPGMPESAIFSLPEDMRTHHNSMMYTCPNGHLYAVGECRQPMQTARCPDCGATIGGINHRAASGNTRFRHEDEKSQAGYLLNERMNTAIDASERMSKQGAAVVQFILHTCMLVGMQRGRDVILSMVQANSTEGASLYLVKQMLKNLDALSTALGRNMDETLLVMFNIVMGLSKQDGNSNFTDWSSMKNRRDWENKFRERFLTPAFQRLDQIVADAADAFSNAKQHNITGLNRLAHELVAVGKVGKSVFKWTDPLFWLYIRRPEASHLLQVLEDSWDVEKSILKIIIQTSDLGLLKYLESVFLLQSALIDKYQNYVDMDDAEKITLKNFENDGGQPYRKYMDDYITVWNKLCPKLRAKHSSQQNVIEHLEPISILSPISVALPSSRGKGQCSKLLAEHLIDIQNDFLAKCKQVMKADDSIHESKVSQLYHSDFVQIDTHEDLLPLIQMHTKYDITRDKRGRHHFISYNINALEKQVRDNFVMHRKLIARQSLPLMQFPQDVGIGNDWAKVLENAPQVVLPVRIAQDVDQLVSGVTSADVCEGVRTLAQAISFLSKVECDRKRNIVEFLEKDLILPANCIPKSAQIEHTLSLYSRLSWHKAVSFTTRGLNPYKDATATGVQKIITSKKLLGQIKEAFEHTDVVILQQKLNEMLIRKEDYSPDWSLKDIFPYYDFLGDDGEDDSWYERLPAKVCFQHTCHLFTLAVQYDRALQ